MLAKLVFLHDIIMQLYTNLNSIFPQLKKKSERAYKTFFHKKFSCLTYLYIPSSLTKLFLMIVEPPTITKRNVESDHANSNLICNAKRSCEVSQKCSYQRQTLEVTITLAFKLKHIRDIYLRIGEPNKHQVLRPTSSMSQRGTYLGTLSNVTHDLTALEQGRDICQTLF